MLRLTTIATDSSGVTLRVDGEIVSDWATFFELECAAWLRQRRALRLDLSGVTQLDGHGVQALRRLRSLGEAELQCTPSIAALLDPPSVP